MTDYYPSIRLIVAVFYFASWFFKNSKPFSVWILILIYGVDYIIAVIVASLMMKITKNTIAGRNF